MRCPAKLGLENHLALLVEKANLTVVRDTPGQSFFKGIGAVVIIDRGGYPLDCAAKLVGVLADERSARETCPVGPVAIVGGGAGDQTAESPAVKVPVGEVKTESAPTGGQTNRQVAARANRSEAPKLYPPRESEGGDVGSAETIVKGRRPASSVKELGACSRRNPGVVEGDMSIQNDQRKLGTTRWSPRPRWGHSEGSAYKPRCGEVALCRRVERMGSNK